MDDHTQFSFEVRLVIARLARMVCKLDGERTSLSSEQEVLALIAKAGEHPRAEIQALFDELLYLMSVQELTYLFDQDVTLPEGYAQMLPAVKREALGAKPRRVYRGQIVED